MAGLEGPELLGVPMFIGSISCKKKKILKLKTDNDDQQVDYSNCQLGESVYNNICQANRLKFKVKAQTYRISSLFFSWQKFKKKLSF